MCGRYTHNLTWTDLISLYRLTLPEAAPAQAKPTWNAAPTQPLPIVRPTGDGLGRELIIAGWGLIPNWLKNLDGKAMSTINARCESVREKPTFRESFERRRCIVPATGWYEWQPAGTRKRPIYMQPRTPFAFAGIWDRWSGPGVPGIVSYAIVTTDAAASIGAYHPRMPVVLEAGHWDQWMLGTPDEAAALMRPYDGAIEAWEVAARVGSPKYNDPELIKPVTAAMAGAPKPKPAPKPAAIGTLL